MSPPQDHETDQFPHAPEISSIPNDDHHQEIKLWSEFMNRVGLDVFQFILSFLPPIPYLFQLKRVSSHWKELCEECMKEDCTELFWDQNSSLVVLNMLKFNLKDYASRVGLPEQYEDELFVKNYGSNAMSYVMFGFLRNVLMNFNKLRSITFRNLELNAALLYLIFVEWGKEVESIKFVQCTVDFSNMSRKILYSENADVITHQQYLYFMDPARILNVKFESKSKLESSFTILLEKMKESKLKNISCYECTCLTGFNTMSIDLILPFELMGLISSIENLESAYYDTLIPLTSFDNLPIFKKLVPNVKFNLPCSVIASKMLVYSKYEEVVDYYFSYLSSNFSLRKTRLKAYQQRKIKNMQEFEHFHNNIIPSLVKFFQVYSPFGLDTDLKDIQGFNILHMAISGDMRHVIDFIFDYFTFYNQDTNNVEDTTRILNHLFAANNRLDGRNSTFIIVTKEKTSIITKMMEHLVHFNAQDRDGLTVAHYYAQFGQISKLKSIIAILDKLPTVAERKYFLNFNITNNQGETAVDICYRYKMFALLRYLAEIAPRYDIQNIPEKLPEEIVLTTEDFAKAFVQKTPPKVPTKKSCLFM
ncbi:ANK domain-containing protein [Naegleria gruberi]|uniref:ANK domain-containing protein n=1 Tax=Naegleria gruberi TaxID=5762 RepID=D2W0I3_NAEGR|nr:ANK domain-containing protein [Naegleria gruberi]EFC37484.1 ANK domain-containing protein [Naegleria gruberi]|eukprot:XP_002670228.1 ANK domain-containing protein [Naegleria gruberi strain NEG-M]